MEEKIGRKKWRNIGLGAWPSAKRKGWAYFTALLAVMAVALFKEKNPLWFGTETPFLLVAGPVILGAWLGGFGPGILATLLGAFSVDYLFLTPQRILLQNGPAENLRLGLFVIEGAFISFVTDRLQQALHQKALSEKKLGQMVESARETAILSTDVKGNIISWNSGAQNVFGFSEEEVLGQNSAILFTPEDRANNRPQYELEKAAKEGHCEDSRWHQRKDGSRIFLIGVMTPIYGDNGQLSGYTKVTRDMTELKRTQEALKESEERLRLAQKSARMTSFEWDIKNNRLSFPEESEVLYGRPLGVSISADAFMEILHPEDRARIQEELRRALTSGEFYTKFRTTWPDQSLHWIAARAQVHYNSDKPLRIVGIHYDITERESLNEKLQQARDDLERLVVERTAKLSTAVEELKRSNQELETFAYIASHDLQEPLRMISSYAQLLAHSYRHGVLAEDIPKYVDTITESITRMRDLINDLLFYSRARTKPLEFLPISLEQVLKDVLANLKAAIDENQAMITHDPLPSLSVDRSQMIQLFQNLISNAIKFRREETPRVHIFVRQDDPNFWIFGVRDNGIGIHKDFFDRIFNIFQRLHSREQYPGTGLGLAICRLIVERHHGKIWLESEPGKGSTFYFTLPKTPPTALKREPEALQP